LVDRAATTDRRQEEVEGQCVGLVKELDLLWIRGSELCLTIVDAQPRSPLREGMQFATSCHTKMVVRLGALWAAVSSAAQSMLGHSPTEAFQAYIVGEMLAKFREQVEQCLYLENSSTRVYDLVLRSVDDHVWSTVHLEEVTERLQAMQEEYREAVIELGPCRALSLGSKTWC
jgi:hypothetical protein